MCPQGYRDINQEDNDEDEEEDDDEENPEDDPDVQDIRWFWCDVPFQAVLSSSSQSSDKIW